MKRISALLTALLLCVCPPCQAESAPTTAGGNTLDASALAHQTADAPVVYFTNALSSHGLMAIHAAPGRKASGENVAMKISTGENGSNYLRVELIGDFVQAMNGTIVENNTAYGGQRASTAMHTSWRRITATRPPCKLQ